MVLSRQARFLILGTGSIGRRHIANIQTAEPAAQFAFYREHGREDDYSLALGATIVRSLEEAITWRPLGAVIANPSDQHAPFALALLSAGIACFIEKPLAINAPDLKLLEDRLTGTLPATQIGCVLRFLPSLQALKQGLVEARLGTVIRAIVEVGQYLPNWRPTQDYRESYSAKRATGGGVFFDLIHEIDLAHWLLGADELLGAWGDKRSHLEIETEDAATLMLRGDHGAQVVVQLDYVARAPIRRISIVGDRGSAVWDMPQRRLSWTDGESREGSTDGFDLKTAYLDSIEEFIAAARTGSPTTLPLERAIVPARIAIEAANHVRKTSPN